MIGDLDDGGLKLSARNQLKAPSTPSRTEW